MPLAKHIRAHTSLPCPPFVPQPMAGSAEGDEVGRGVGAALGARFAVMDLQEARVDAARRPAVVAVAGQDLAAGVGWDRRRVAAFVRADCRVSLHALGVGAAEGPAVCLDFSALGTFVQVDLDRLPAGGFRVICCGA